MQNYKIHSKLEKEHHRPGESDPFVCKILYNGYIIMGRHINQQWFGPTIFIFDSKGVFYGYFQGNKPVEGTLVIDDVQYKGTFKDNGAFKKGEFNFNNKLFIRFDSSQSQHNQFKVFDENSVCIDISGDEYSMDDHYFRYTANEKSQNFEFYLKDQMNKI